MAVPNLDPINTAVTKNIMPGLADGFFKNDPLLLFLKDRYNTYPGGPTIQENFVFRPMKGGAYSKGVGGFDIGRRQTFAGALFHPKYYQVSIPEYLEEIEVEVNGPTAVMSMVKTDMGNAALTMSAILAVDLYHGGQNVAVAGDRSLNLNGLAELGDGSIASWDGATYTSYGEQVIADVGSALKTPTGFISSPNINGSITFRVMEHTYQSVCLGGEYPVMGVTTNRCMGYISETWQPHQVVDAVEPTIGYTGIKFKRATIVQSQYCPGADGVNDADIGNYNATNETFWWLNPGPTGEDAYIKLRISVSRLFQFGFTGFKVTQDGTSVAGQILFAGNVTMRNRRLQRPLYGITS